HGFRKRAARGGHRRSSSSSAPRLRSRLFPPPCCGSLPPLRRSETYTAPPPARYGVMPFELIEDEPLPFGSVSLPIHAYATTPRRCVPVETCGDSSSNLDPRPWRRP